MKYKRLIIIVLPLFFFLWGVLPCMSQERKVITHQIGWWKLFNDKQLDSLIEYALANNNNVLQAIDRIYAAKASLRMARGEFFPSVGVDASWSRGRETPALPYGNNLTLEATTNWEIDVFGSIRNRVRSQDELYKVSVSDYNAVLVSLCAEVATAYVNLRTLQQQQSVAESNIESQLRVLAITQARYKAGLVSKLDVLQANTVYLSTKATLPLIKSQIMQTINGISVLLGLEPDVLKSDLLVSGPIPQIENITEIDIPMDVLLQRPDIKAAEHMLNSYAALAGAAKSDWFPKFYFKGSIGFSSDKFRNVFRSDKTVFTINPTISWTLFSGRQLQEASRRAKAQFDEAVANYNQTVLTAIQEVDNAMSSYLAYQEQVEDFTEVQNEEVEVLKLSIELYKKGLQNFQTVLDAQRSLLSYENSLVSAQGNLVTSIISLYKSFGGI